MKIDSFGDRGSILMLHRVAPYEHGKLIHNENLKLSPLELARVIEELIRDGRTFVGLHRIEELSRRKGAEEKFVAFTLDDGYRDNLEYAYPIFKQHDIPFCIYITNSFPNRTTNLWWYALEILILENRNLTVSGRRVSNETSKQKAHNFLEIRRQIIDTHFRNPIQFMRSIGRLNFDFEKEINDKCLTWHEIEELSKDNLVTIGCHTDNHYPLSKLPVEEMRSEISKSKTEIEKRIGKNVRHFAFPFGTKREAGPREYQVASELGFDSAVTAIHGHVSKNDDLHALGRIFLYPLQNNRTTLKQVMYGKVGSFYYSILNKIEPARK